MPKPYLPRQGRASFIEPPLVVALIMPPAPSRPDRIRTYHADSGCDARLRDRGLVVPLSALPLKSAPCRRCWRSTGYLVPTFVELWEQRRIEREHLAAAS